MIDGYATFDLKEHKKLGKILKEQRDLILKLRTDSLDEKEQIDLEHSNRKVRDLLDDLLHENFDKDESGLIYFG